MRDERSDLNRIFPRSMHVASPVPDPSRTLAERVACSSRLVYGDALPVITVDGAQSALLDQLSIALTVEGSPTHAAMLEGELALLGSRLIAHTFTRLAD